MSRHAEPADHSDTEYTELLGESEIGSSESSERAETDVPTRRDFLATFASIGAVTGLTGCSATNVTPAFSKPRQSNSPPNSKRRVQLIDGFEDDTIHWNTIETGSAGYATYSLVTTDEPVHQGKQSLRYRGNKKKIIVSDDTRNTPSRGDKFAWHWYFKDGDQGGVLAFGIQPDTDHFTKGYEIKVRHSYWSSHPNTITLRVRTPESTSPITLDRTSFNTRQHTGQFLRWEVGWGVSTITILVRDKSGSILASLHGDDDHYSTGKLGMSGGASVTRQSYFDTVRYLPLPPSEYPHSIINANVWLGHDVPDDHYESAFKRAVNTLDAQLDGTTINLNGAYSLSSIQGNEFRTYGQLFAAMKRLGIGEKDHINILLYKKDNWLAPGHKATAVNNKGIYQKGKTPLVIINTYVNESLPDPDAYTNTAITGITRPILQGAMRHSNKYDYLPDKFNDVNEFGTVEKQPLNNQASPLATWHVKTGRTCFTETRFANNDYVNQLCGYSDPPTACGFTTTISECTKSTIEQYLQGPVN